MVGMVGGWCGWGWVGTKSHFCWFPVGFLLLQNNISRTRIWRQVSWGYAPIHVCILCLHYFVFAFAGMSSVSSVSLLFIHVRWKTALTELFNSPRFKLKNTQRWQCLSWSLSSDSMVILCLYLPACVVSFFCGLITVCLCFLVFSFCLLFLCR